MYLHDLFQTKFLTTYYILLQPSYGPWALTVTESTCNGKMNVIILEKT